MTQDRKSKTRRGVRTLARRIMRHHASRVAAALAVGILATSAATAQGVGYTIAPAATRVQWTDRLGLENSSLYGGQLSLDFDRFASLQGYYFTNSNGQTSLGRLGLSGPIAGVLGDQEIGIRSYGANILLSLWGGGAISPFVKGGGGILEFRPDVGGKSRQIALDFGGGLRFGANGPVFLDLFAEDKVFRLDRYALFAPTGPGNTAIPADPDANTLRHNLSVGAAVGLPFGPARSSLGSGDVAPFQWGLAGASLALEPMAGRLTFADDVGIADQDLVGVRGGIDLGRLVGLRGFYWRGTENDFKRTSAVQSWGAEAQFRLNSGPGLLPYLLVGGAQLDFLSDFRNLQGRNPADKTALLLGGGITIPISERFGINATARDYLLGQGSGIDSVSSPSDLTSNWMFSAGLRVSLGGRAGTSVAERARDRARERDRRYATRLDSLRSENARLDSLARENTELDSLRTENARLAHRLGIAPATAEDSAALLALRSDSTARARTRIDSSTALRDSTARRAMMRELFRRQAATDTAFAGEVDLAPSRADFSTDKVVTLPVPALGELYVRYGPSTDGRSTTVLRGDPRTALRQGGDSSAWGPPLPPGTLPPDELRRMIRETMREELRGGSRSYDDRYDDGAYAPPRTRERDDILPERTLRERMREERLRPARPDSLRGDRDDRLRPPALRDEFGRDPERRIPIQPKERRERPLSSTDVAPRTTMSNEELATTLGDRIGATLDDRLRRMDDRLTRMQDSMRVAMREEMRRSIEADRAANPPAPVVVTPTPAPSVTREVVVQRPRAVADYGGRRISTYSGFTANDAGQILLGARFDAGPVSSQAPGVRFVPELALGFGSGGQSTMIVGNALYRFGTARLGNLPPITPHVLGGIGLLNFSDKVGSRDGLEAVVNLGYGVTFPLGNWRFAGQRPLLQVEHQGIDFFDLNRLLIGLQWGS